MQNQMLEELPYYVQGKFMAYHGMTNVMGVKSGGFVFEATHPIENEGELRKLVTIYNYGRVQGRREGKETAQSKIRGALGLKKKGKSA